MEAYVLYAEIRNLLLVIIVWLEVFRKACNFIYNLYFLSLFEAVTAHLCKHTYSYPKIKF